MIEIVTVLAMIGAIVCFIDWQRGLLVVIWAGFAQDPVRKMLEGQPVWMTVACGAFFALAVVGAMGRGMPMSLRPILRAHPKIELPLVLFIAWALVQIAFAFVRTGSVMIAGIGSIAYLTPVAALAVAFWFARRESNVRTFCDVYIFLATAMMATVLMAATGVDGELFEPVGEGIYIYPSEGGKLKLPSGLFRSPENAAWHGATAVSLLVILYTSRRWRLGIGTAALIGIIGIVGVIVTGRRKMVMEMLLFLCLYGALLAFFRRGALKLAMFLLFTGLLAALAQPLVFPDSSEVVFQAYLARSQSVFGDALDRLKQMTVDSFGNVLAHNGILGSGAGVGGQGAQHFGGGLRMVGGAAEGGMGKMLAELGVPGALIFAWLLLAGVRTSWMGIRRAAAARVGEGVDALSLGFAALILSNFAVYVSASQIFGDPFVLITLGMLTGFVLAAPLMKGRAPGGVVIVGPAVETDRSRDRLTRTR